jgi:hypothetical protein
MAFNTYPRPYLTNQNFPFYPSINQRSICAAIPAETKVKSSPKQKRSQSKIYDKALTTPFPHFPLEVPKISRLVYHPVNSNYKKRWGSIQRPYQTFANEEEQNVPESTKNSERRYSKQEPSDTEIVVKHQYSKRVYFNRKKNNSSVLLIIVYEGVLGDFYKQKIWDSKSSDLAICPNWAKGMVRLYKKVNLAVISSTDKSDFLKKYFKEWSVQVDAIYERKGQQPRYLQDYSQIILDFDCQNVFILSSIGLESQDLDERSDWDLCYEPTLSIGKRILLNMFPIYNASYPTPSVFLIPNPRAQNNELAIDFFELSGVILKFIKHKGNGIQGLRTFAVPWSKLNVECNESVSIQIYTGKGLKKKPYIHFVYKQIITQIELNNFLKPKNNPNNLVSY